MRLVTICSISAAGRRRPAGVARPTPGDQRAGDVIAVTPAVLDRMGHALALTIEQQPGEQARVLHPETCAALDRVGGEPGLDRIPQTLIDDCGVLAGIGLVLVDDLAAVDPVANIR
jgi:hypothetical protein